jgi:hypothetical protein
MTRKKFDTSFYILSSWSMLTGCYYQKKKLIISAYFEFKMDKVRLNNILISEGSVRNKILRGIA